VWAWAAWVVAVVEKAKRVSLVAVWEQLVYLPPELPMAQMALLA